MTTRRITLATDVGNDAAHAFRSMLEVLSGRTSCAWQLVDTIERADVVVSGNAAQLMSTSPARDRRVIAVVEKAAPGIRPNTPYVLTHPFRVMQVLSMLDEIEDEYKRPEMRIERSPELGHWDFAESVRALAATSSQASWYCAKTAAGAEVIVTGNLHSFACEAVVFEQIRTGSTTLSALAPASVQSVPLNYVRRPACELFWHNAFNASMALAPWIEGRGSFHIRRWPDFGTIPATRQHLQLVAMLAKHGCSRAQLAHATNAAMVDIDRLLNALSICDLLVFEESTAVARAKPSAQLPGFFRSLLSSLRRSLDLAY